MKREQVIRILREHEQELKRAGLVRLDFSAPSRGEAGNDVDLLAEFDSTKRWSLLERVGLESRLSDLLEARWNLAPAKMLKDAVAQRATDEAVHVL